MEELWYLKKLGLNNIHMYADLFTVSRDQVVELCNLMITEKIGIKWTCNSRVDYVDEEMLALMGKAGCRLISWGIESGSEQILKHARKGAYPDKAERALRWAKKAGIMNWGYFIIGLPGETEATIRQTIDFAKKLPLDIALFHVAAMQQAGPDPHPGQGPTALRRVRGELAVGGEPRAEQSDEQHESEVGKSPLPPDPLIRGS